jgi:hypothetical protein
MPRGKPIYANGKMVGKVIGGTFYKNIYELRGHLLRKPPAIAFDEEIVRQLQSLDVKQIEVRVVDVDKVYKMPLWFVLARGFRFNRGHGDQIGVPLATLETAARYSANAGFQAPLPIEI